MDDILYSAGVLLGEGREPRDLGAGQMALRALVVYVAMIAVVRLSKKRFMGRASAFDVILGIMIGSIASRGITGNAPLFPTLVSVATLLGLHWAFSGLALLWSGIGVLLKGRPVVLIRNGIVDQAALSREHMTRADLDEALRRQGMADIAETELATLERNGNVSVVRRSSGA